MERGLGIVGAGTIFEQHARACAALPGRVRLVGVADVDEAKIEAAASRHDIPSAYSDYRQLLLRADVDIVAVCTPPCAHEEVVIGALEAGKYVLCEKPLAHTLAAADRILDAARRFPGRLSTVYQFRYLAEVQRTVWLRDRGRLGPLLFGRFSRYARYQRPAKTPKPGRTPRPRRADWWGRWAVADGGAAMTQLIHELDLVCHIFGPAAEDSAIIDTLKAPIESEDTCVATIRLASGAIVCCYATVSAHRTANGFDVFGQLGSVHYPWTFECMERAWREDALRAVLGAYPPAPDPEESAHTPYLRAVLDAIDMGRPLPIGPDEARGSLELCVALYASALTHHPITLPIERTNRYYEGITTADYDGRRRDTVAAAVGHET